MTARLVRVALDGEADPYDLAAWLEGEPRPVALVGAWAGGGALLSSHPVRMLGAGEDPFAALDDVDPVTGDGAAGAVGGGWLGWLGFGLARALEAVPPSPPRPVVLPDADLALHDHVVRRDADGRWWFEALSTPARAALLDERLACWRGRLAVPAPALAAAAAPATGALRVAAPGTRGHAAAVAAARERIAAGEVFQVNLCLRLEGALDGSPLALWRRAGAALRPAYAAYVGGADHAVVSLSPELFLRRRGRAVVSEPIKGTGADPDALAVSAKDRAENVMIADLVRNDLGRVCEYGSVRADALAQVRPAAGVWHLVSTIAGRLRGDVGDAELVRAAFPPGSVTGAPKIRALRVLSELEATGREAYCGAIGFASPLAGLELNVAIRTFEAAAGRLWLGAGGGIVADSAPEAEVAEALAKARPLCAAAGLHVDEDPDPSTGDERSPTASAAAGPPRSARPAQPLHALDVAARPDPERGLLETILVRDGRAVALDAHLDRLRASALALGLTAPGAPLREQAQALAATAPPGAVRLRLLLDAAGATAQLAPAPASDAPVALIPALLPGGLGAHKWADRRLVDALATPLLVDLDGSVLEAGHAAVLAVAGNRLIAPPLDGRILPSLTRARVLAAAPRAGLRATVAPLDLTQLRAADAVVLASALRGAHPAVLDGGPDPARSTAWAARLRAAAS